MRPVKLRGLQSQLARGVLAARAQLVKQRTEIVNLVRSQVRNLGESIPSCSAGCFHKRAPEHIPHELDALLAPMLEVLRGLAQEIEEYDAEITRRSREDFPETQVLMQVDGLGPITALGFAATIEAPSRLKRSRDVGAYVGLVSKARSSGQGSSAQDQQAR